MISKLKSEIMKTVLGSNWAGEEPGNRAGFPFHVQKVFFDNHF